MTTFRKQYPALATQLEEHPSCDPAAFAAQDPALLGVLDALCRSVFGWKGDGSEYQDGDG